MNGSPAGEALSEPEVLDLRGLKCPLPALFARRALLRARPGAAVAVLADDPMARIDVPHMCRQEGFEVLSVTQTGAGVEIAMRVRVGAPPLS